MSRSSWSPFSKKKEAYEEVLQRLIPECLLLLPNRTQEVTSCWCGVPTVEQCAALEHSVTGKPTWILIEMMQQLAETLLVRSVTGMKNSVK